MPGLAPVPILLISSERTSIVHYIIVVICFNKDWKRCCCAWVAAHSVSYLPAYSECLCTTETSFTPFLLSGELHFSLGVWVLLIRDGDRGREEKMTLAVFALYPHPLPYSSYITVSLHLTSSYCLKTIFNCYNCSVSHDRFHAYMCWMSKGRVNPSSL